MNFNKENKSFWHDESSPVGVGIIVVIGVLAFNWVWSYSFQSWDNRGQSGDMFGFSNAIFSGIAFVGVLYTIHIQKKELSETRSVHQEQQIDSIFFNLLKLRKDTIDSIIQKDRNTNEILKGIEALSYLKILLEIELGERFGDIINPEDEEIIMRPIQSKSLDDAFLKFKKGYKSFYYFRSDQRLSAYFRVNFNILKFINEKIKDAEKQELYVSIYKSQLYETEFLILLCNSNYPKLGNPKALYLYNKYLIFEHFDFSSLAHFDKLEEVFSNLRPRRTDNPFKDKRYFYTIKNNIREKTYY